MYLAKFEMMKNKRYVCKGCWTEQVARDVALFHNDFVPIIRHIWLVVSVKPPLGFCKRPHKYL